MSEPNLPVDANGNHLEVEIPPNVLHDIDGKPFHYLKNKKIKECGTQIAYSKAHVDELIRCADDVEYFANRYYKIVHQDHGKINIDLREYQKRCLREFTKNRFNIAKWPRQSGKSTTFEVFVCHFILFNPFKRVVLLANKEKQSKALLARIKMAYENLPYWMQQGVAEWNKTGIKLENGCEVIATTTASDASRGEAVGLLIVDECAFVPSNLWGEFWESVYPTIASAKTSKIILVSTPKGMNHFYKLWREAEAGENTFVPVEVKWTDVPGYDDAFKIETIKNIGQRKWDQEFETNFLASSNSLLPLEVMEKMIHKTPLQQARVGIIKDIKKINENIIESTYIYEKPKEDHEYMIGVDPAKITEDNSGDSLAVQIIDVTNVPFRQVATIVINSGIHYLEVPKVLQLLGYYYNSAYIFIENNDQVGLSIADSLTLDYEYENIYSEKAGVFGFRTTTRTKKIACLSLKMLIETNKLKIHDITTISQLSTYIKKSNSYEAEIGYSDDAVAALNATLIFMQDRMGWEHKINMINDRTKMKEVNEKIDPKTGRRKRIDSEADIMPEDEEPMDQLFSNSGDEGEESIF